MFKKSSIFFLTCCIALSLSLVAFAATPRYAYINSSSTNLSISGGTATSIARIRGVSNLTTKVEIFAQLQQYRNNSWDTIESWSGAANSNTIALEKQAVVAKGFKYRLKSTYSVYAGANKEQIVEYSKEVSS